MENRAHALAAGVFVLLLALASVFALWWFGNNREAVRRYVLVSEGAIPGLNEQAQVRFRGIRAGKVMRIGIDPKNPRWILVEITLRADLPVTRGTRASLGVQIPVVAPPFEARGEVVWCRRVDACYELGIQFSSEADAFAARMVEQLCYIERYRNEVLTREGRVIDSQTAASEWINKFAASFPHIS